MKTLYSLFGEGVEAQHLTVGQVLLRAVVVFFATLIIVRFANKRFFARKTAFDIILGFILGSIMARAVNGSEQLIPTIVAGFALAILHRLLGYLACRWKWFGDLIKGSTQTLVEAGNVHQREMTQHHITNEDLLEELRLKGVERPADAKFAILERSGEISVVPK
jgi:uncharacterized membrane protein YcaP (DUF421 family)